MQTSLDLKQLLGADELTMIRSRARALSLRFRLPFRRVTQYGHAGKWLSSSLGSSIEFQDHRAYHAGDDPRHIDWRAYARTEVYTLKQFRDEINPFVDIVLDTSRSMFYDWSKATRVLELFYFVVESVIHTHAAARLFLVQGNIVRQLPVESALRDSFLAEFVASGETVAPDLKQIPFRSSGIRLLISDLLWPVAPGPFVVPLASGRGEGILFVPCCAAEQAPDWAGNVSFSDCESSSLVRKQFVDRDLLERYHTAYRRHFGEWRDTCIRHHIPFVTIDSAVALETTFATEALTTGALELCS